MLEEVSLEKERFLKEYSLDKESIMSFRKNIRVVKEDSRLFDLLMERYSEGSDYDKALDIIKSGTDIDYKDSKKGDYPLLISVRKGLIKTSSLIIRAGANIDNESNFKTTALMTASRHGHLELVKILVLLGAKVNSKCLDGYTALMYAKKYGMVDVFKYLIQSGAYLDDLNFLNESAVSINSKDNLKFGIDSKNEETSLDYMKLLEEARANLESIKRGDINSLRLKMIERF